MIDAYYTSSAIADDLLLSLPNGFRAKCIADFSAGNGNLLASAGQAFPDARIFYNDINASVAAQVRCRKLGWKISVSDFLNVRSQSSAAYSKIKFDLILLNPPFSQRGVPLISEKCDLNEFNCSIALAFVSKSLRYLSAGGNLLAVLPMGCFRRRIDIKAWKFIEQSYEVHHVRDLGCFAFAKARANTRVVRIFSRRNPIRLAQAESFLPSPSSRLHRGNFQMHFSDDRYSVRQRALVHTTQLKSGKVTGSDRFVRWIKWIDGPAVLFPRVGKIDAGKVCILKKNVSVVLSDCVFAVSAASNSEAEYLRESIIQNWDEFSLLYGGTGAPYATLERIEFFLRSHHLL